MERLAETAGVSRSAMARRLITMALQSLANANKTGDRS